MTKEQILEMIDAVIKYGSEYWYSSGLQLMNPVVTTGCTYDEAENNWKIYSIDERGSKHIWYVAQDESTAYVKLLRKITCTLQGDARDKVIERYHEVVSLPERLEISKNELIESNFDDYSEYIYFDVYVSFFTEIPYELREKWAREFIEEQVDKFNFEEYNPFEKTKGILGNGLMYKDFVLLDRFYNMLCQYNNISVENKESIIRSISSLFSTTSIEIRKNKYIISDTEEQREYLLRLCDLAEEIFSSIDLDNLNYVASVGRYRNCFNDESRLSDFKKYLVKAISSIREYRTIIGL